MLLLVLQLFNFISQERDFSIESFIFELRFSSKILYFKVLFFNLIFEFSYIQLLKLVVSVLRSFKGLNLIHGFIFVFVFKLTEFYLFHIFHINHLIMESINFGNQFINLMLMFLVFDIEMIKDFLLFSLNDVGVSVLMIKLLLQKTNVFIFLLEQFNEILILINEMSILSQQKFDFIFEIVDSLIFSHL